MSVLRLILGVVSIPIGLVIALAFLIAKDESYVGCSLFTLVVAYVLYIAYFDAWLENSGGDAGVVWLGLMLLSFMAVGIVKLIGLLLP